MKKFVILVVLMVVGSNSYSKSEDNKLPGTLYKVSIQMTDDEISKGKEELAKSDPKIIKSLALGINGKTQKNSRIVGLRYCKSKGFETIGAVFWRGNVLIGAHCLEKAEDRYKYLSKTYSAGCKKLVLNSDGCARIMKKLSGYKSEFVDATTEEQVVDAKTPPEQPGTKSKSSPKTLR